MMLSLPEMQARNEEATKAQLQAKARQLKEAKRIFVKATKGEVLAQWEKVHLIEYVVDIPTDGGTP